MPTINLEQTITIAMSVKDRHASAKWYVDHLGFELLFHGDDVGWSELKTKTDGVTLGLGEQAKAAPGNATPVFSVPDVDAARAALEQQGVAFDGPTQTIDGMVKLASFYDPDKNALMLAEDLAS